MDASYINDCTWALETEAVKNGKLAEIIYDLASIEPKDILFTDTIETPQDVADMINALFGDKDIGVEIEVKDIVRVNNKEYYEINFVNNECFSNDDLCDFLDQVGEFSIGGISIDNGLFSGHDRYVFADGKANYESLYPKPVYYAVMEEGNIIAVIDQVEKDHGKFSGHEMVNIDEMRFRTVQAERSAANEQLRTDLPMEYDDISD